MTGVTRRSPLGRAVSAAVLLICSAHVGAQSDGKFCEGENGQVWTCDPLTSVPSDVISDDFLPLPGSPDPANPTVYKQIAGEPAFDEDGRRNGKTAVFALHEGLYFCMLAESQGEAVLFDAPEGAFVSSSGEFPTGSWLGESVKALLSEGTKLKYIVITHSHWDHMGGTRFVVDYFADDEPIAISSKRTRRAIKLRAKKDPTTVFGNNRDVPIPVAWGDTINVGGLQFLLETVHVHKTGDSFVLLDKNLPQNAEEGIDVSIGMVTDMIFPGWVPFYFASTTHDTNEFYAALDEVNGYDFDILVGGHLTRLGTKEDVSRIVDFYADVLAGAQAGLSVVDVADSVTGTGSADPDSPNFGNSWLLFNEYLERVVDACVEYVLDSSARGRDWKEELAGLEVTLRSQCWLLQSFVRIG